MPRTNPSKLERLPIELRFEVARRMLNNVDHEVIRDYLAVRGVAPDELPQDRAFRSYRESEEYVDLRERLLDGLTAESTGGASQGVVEWQAAEALDDAEVVSRARALRVLERRLSRADRVFELYCRADEMTDWYEKEVVEEALFGRAGEEDAASEGEVEGDWDAAVADAVAAGVFVDTKVTDCVGKVTDYATDGATAAGGEGDDDDAATLTPTERRARKWAARRDRLARHPGMMSSSVCLRALALQSRLIREQRAALATRPANSPANVSGADGASRAGGAATPGAGTGKGTGTETGTGRLAVPAVASHVGSGPVHKVTDGVGKVTDAARPAALSGASAAVAVQAVPEVARSLNRAERRALDREARRQQ